MEKKNLKDGIDLCRKALAWMTKASPDVKALEPWQLLLYLGLIWVGSKLFVSVIEDLVREIRHWLYPKDTNYPD